MMKSNMSIGGIAYTNEGLRETSGESLMMLLDVIKGFNRLTDFEQIVAEIGHATKSLMNAQASVLMLLDGKSDELCVRFCTGSIKEALQDKCIPRDHGFSGWAAAHKLPLIANDIHEHADTDSMFGGALPKTFTLRNLICAPLLDKDNNLMGVLEAINRFDPPTLSEKDLPVFQALANHAATTIERVREERQQNDRLKEQDMYLTEIHHRVKNDLALISGIVEIESLDIENEPAQNVLKNIQSRIKSMAVVYELLSGEGSHTKAEVGTYFKKLVEGISGGLDKKNKDIDIQISTESVVIDPYKALSCGLILNELLLNSYKHAFGDRDEGLIEIELSKKDNLVFICYKDDGPGFGEDFHLEEQESIGFKMIHALVQQLDGELEIVEGEGAHLAINFPANENHNKTSLKRVVS